MTCTGALGGSKSAVQMLNSMSERTPPGGAQVLNGLCMAVWFLYIVLALRPLM